MAITIPATGPGTAVPVVATESHGVAGHFQFFKLIDGNVGSLSPVGTSANPLNITQPALQNIVGSIGVTQLGGVWNIGGEIAHGAADSGSPAKIGGIAVGSLNPTAVDSGDRVNAWFDYNGRIITRPFAPRSLVLDKFTTLNNSNQTICLSGLANTLIDITTAWVLNRSPLPVRVDFRDSSGSAIHFAVTAPGSAPGAIQTIEVPIAMPIVQIDSATGLSWTAQLGSGSTVNNSVNDVQLYVQGIRVTA